MQPIRIVIENHVSTWKVSCFAFDHDLIFHSSVVASADVPGEVVWVSRDAATMCSRMEDHFSGMTFLMFRGEGAEALAAAAVDELEGLDSTTLLLAMRSRDDKSLSDSSIAALGILAPLTFEATYFETFQWLLHHPSADVRCAAIRATCYPAWPELIPELDGLADKDSDDVVRSAASQIGSGLRAQQPAETGMP